MNNNNIDASTFPLDVQATLRDIGYLIVYKNPELLHELIGDDDEVSCIHS